MKMMPKNGPAARCSLPSVLLAIASLLGCGTTESDASSPHSSERPEQTKPNTWIPEPQRWVTDLAGILSDERADEIATMLAAYEEETSHEFAILTVEDLHGEEIGSFSLRVARSWGIGKVDACNGLLVVLAPKDRKTRIEVANGLLDLIPDDLAQKIMDRDMVPAFREGRYADGIEAGLKSLMDAAR